MTPRDTTIDTVVFDFGQVLVKWDPYLAFDDIMTPAQFDDFHAEIDFPTFNHAQDAGRSIAEARVALAATHPHRVTDFDHYVANFPRTLPGPVPGSAEIVAELRKAGLRLLGCTNWSRETIAAAPEVAPIIKELDGVLVSGREGLAKPDPAIFRLLVARFTLEPSATLFIDDSAQNVAAASGIGLHAWQFTSAAALRDQLIDLSLLQPQHQA